MGSSLTFWTLAHESTTVSLPLHKNWSCLSQGQSSLQSASANQLKSVAGLSLIVSVVDDQAPSGSLDDQSPAF